MGEYSCPNMFHPQDNNKTNKIAHGAITVTHITIRQSLFFLVLKLAFIEVLAAAFVIAFHSMIARFDLADALVLTNALNMTIFLALVILKTATTIYILADWVDEYYEITPKQVRHIRGIIIKREESNTLEHMANVRIDQGVMGRIFNYGTLTLYNWASEQQFTLYLIHNPRKYMNILKEILPDVDMEAKVLRERLFENKDK